MKAAPASPPTLYEQLGGESAILSAAYVLHDKLLADPVVAPYFESMSMDTLIRKQTAFMMLAFGAESARDEDLVIDGMGDTEYDRVAEHLHESLVELGVSGDLVEQVTSLVEGLRGEVLAR